LPAAAIVHAPALTGVFKGKPLTESESEVNIWN